MNRLRYKLVFNRHRGALMAVAESTSVVGGKGNASAFTGLSVGPVIAGLRFSLLAVVLALSLSMPGVSHAQILGDRNAPQRQQPTVLSAPNGVPLVNIQTPNAAGVSLNAYRQFDVGPNGVILNNARQATRTRLGGTVQGNPWLATGSARVIINQVNSTSPSFLRGYIEVAGQRAQVVIANPNGITCAGCGFINAHRATLTTGTPLILRGNLDGFRVAGGVVTVDEGGLDAGGADFTDIIARAVRIDADVRAQRLSVTAGVNTVSADHQRVEPVAADADADADAAEDKSDTPDAAIDVGLLGGMYARHIFLTATEHGVGVRNAGKIGAVAGDAVVTVDGRLENRGVIGAPGDAELKVAGVFTNVGTASAGGKLAITAGTIDNRDSGILMADRLCLKATDSQTFINRGLIDGTQTLIQSAVINNIGTGRIYGNHVAIAAGVLNNIAETVDDKSAAAVIAGRDRVDIGAGEINNEEHALIYSMGDMFMGGELDAGKQATGRARVVGNRSAAINAEGDLAITADAVNNTNIHLETENEFSIGRRRIRYRLNGSPAMIDSEDAWLVNVGSGAVIEPGNWRAMGNEDNFRLLLPSSAYPAERYGPAFDYSRGGWRNNGPIAPAYVRAWFSGSSDGPAERPEIFSYGPGDRIWAIMGVAAPVEVPGPRPVFARSHEACYHSCYTATVIVDDLMAWRAAYAAWRPQYDAFVRAALTLDERISAFNNDVHNRSIREWTIYDGTEHITRTVVTRSDPGVITSGGHMDLAADAVNNHASQIIAGGALAGDSVNGTAIRNTGATGEQRVTSTGAASYTYIQRNRFRADDRRYRAVPYESQTIVTHFPLDISPTGGVHPAQGNAESVHSSGPRQALPDSSFYTIDPAAAGQPLIRADQPFTGDHAWASSAYQLDQLPDTPASRLKRLGDGFYEQQLVQQQIQQAVGQRYLPGYTSNEAQYMALMNAGVAQSRSFDYAPGVALTAAQMARLTEDMVWMVRQTVVLDDGSTQEVLAPQLYLRPSQARLTGQGALIAANTTDFRSAQDIVNHGGTIAARETLSLAGNNIDNLGGRMTGADMRLQALTDIRNNGGAIHGDNSVVAQAGRDFNSSSTTVDTRNGTTTGTNISQVASITGKELSLGADRDFNANAAVIAADGGVNVSARRDVNFGVVRQAYTEEINWDNDDGASNWVSMITGPNLLDHANGAHGVREVGINRAKVSASKEEVTQVTGGAIGVDAGRDLTARGTQLIAQAALQARAGRDLVADTANESASARDQHQNSASGILSGTTVQTDDAGSVSREIGSTFSGNTTTLGAGRNADVRGSDVVSTRGTQVTAENDLNITAATDTTRESHYRKETTSGVFSGGGFGLTVGSKTHGSDATRETSTASASTVGATDGNVELRAGGEYRQVASNVLAPEGDIGITAKQVEIAAGLNTERNTQESFHRQQGVTVEISNPLLSAVQTGMAMQEASGKTKSGRAKLLADAATALAAGNALAEIAANPAAATGVNLSFSLGASSSESKTEQHGSSNAASTVAAKETTSIAAVDGGQESNLDITGSDITGRNVELSAENQVNLRAQRHDNEEHSTNKSRSGSIGVSIGSSGLMFNASASGSRGKGDGSDTSHANTHVSAAEQLRMTSGGDTNIQGATAAGKQVTADIGGDLNIESLQDTSFYKSQQQSVGGSVSAGVGGGGATVSASRSKVEGNYKSVIEQSGINAGDDGFQVTVAGNTDLKGAKIASTDPAVEDGKNSFITGSLTTSDIRNESDYKAEGVSFSAGASYSSGATGNSEGQGKSDAKGQFKPADTGMGFASESGSESSITRSGVSGMAGDMTVRSDKDSTNALVKKWDGKELQADVEAQAKIMETFGKQAAQGIGNYAARQLKKAKEAGDVDGIEKWKEGGAWHVTLHAIAGALAGGPKGAAGAAASAATIPHIATAIKEMALPEGITKSLIAAAGATLGAGAGGEKGAAAGLNQTANNYLKHTEDDAKREEKASCTTSSDPASCRRGIESAYNQIGRDRQQRQCTDAQSCRANRDEITADLRETSTRQAELDRKLYQGKLTEQERQEYFSNGQQIQLMQSALQEANRQIRQVIPASEWTAAEKDQTFSDAMTAVGGLASLGVANRPSLSRTEKNRGEDKTATSGKDVVAGPVNFMGNGDQFFKNASKRSDVDPNGSFDVVAHGSAQKIEVMLSNGPVVIDHRVAAELIRRTPGYNGQPLRLLSCDTGACDLGFAQNLSNKMGIPVHAPTELVWAYGNGKMVVAPRLSSNPSSPLFNVPDLDNLGTFRVFVPRKEK